MHVCTLDNSDFPAFVMPARQRHGVLAAVVALHAAALAGALTREAPAPAFTAPVVVTLYAEPRATPTPSAAPEPRARSVSKPTASPAPQTAATPAPSRRDPAPVLATDGAQAAATTPASAPAAAATGSAVGGGAATAAPAAPAPVTPPVFSADYLQNPAPAYPSLARRQGQQGRVVLRVLVNATGAAEQLEVRTSSGHAALDGAALEAVRRWRFVPARQGQDPVPAWVLIPLNFFLQG